MQASTLNPRLFWTVIGLYLLLRLTIAALNYRGDSSDEARDRALRYFSSEVVERGVEYHRSGFAVSVLYLLVELSALLVVVLSGFSPWLAERCLGWSGGRPWLRTSLFLLLFSAGAWLFELPFRYYFGYVLEHRFGFSNLDRTGWFVFQLKQAAAAGLLLVVLGTLGYMLLERFPRAWVWIVPALFLPLQLFLTLLYPYTLLPLFYKIEPLENPAVARAVIGVTEKAGVEVGAIYQIDASRYSSHTNAFFTGFGRFKSIYLYDTLIEGRTPEEVAVVFAHEFGHWKHGHVLKGLLLSWGGVIVGCLLFFYLFPIFERSDFLRVGPIHDVAGLPLLILTITILNYCASPIVSGVSRRFERQADRASIELTDSRETYISDFTKMAIENRSDLLPHPVMVFWRYTHPPIIDRLEMIDEVAGNPGS